MPVVRKRSSAAPARVDHAERGVARAGQLGGGLDEPLEQRVERQLRVERDPGVEERRAADRTRHAYRNYRPSHRRLPDLARPQGPPVGGNDDELAVTADRAFDARVGVDDRLVEHGIRGHDGVVQKHRLPNGRTRLDHDARAEH